jgi:DNA primase
MIGRNLDKDRLKAHANKHITRILDTLNIEYTEHGQLFQGCCPAHDHPGDRNNKTAFSWKEEANGWVCWSHGCNDRWGSDVFGLVSAVLNVYFQQAVQFVFDALSKYSVNIESEVVQSNRIDTSRPKLHKPIAENCLKFLEEKYDLYPLGRTLIQRGFDPKILRMFRVGFWHQFGTFMNDRIIFPIRDHEGFLVGFSGRTIYPKDKWDLRNVKSKWIHSRHFSHWPKKDDNLLTTSILYNLYNAVNCLSNGSIFLVEGPLDGLKLEQAGIYNWVANLGVRNFSPAHRTLLINAGVNRLSVAFDPDSAGVNGVKKVREIAGDFFNIDTIELPGKDPGDMTIEEIQKVFS